MARPSLFQHRKFRTLARRLGSRALAVGSLELLWAVANDAGDPLIGTAEDVEDVADWRGEPGLLARSLVETRFMDETPEGFAVHDHDHHCPTYVRRRRDRERARRANGTPATSQRRVTDAPLDTTPISHHPSPNKKERTPKPPSAAPPEDGVADTFDAFWTAYPKHQAKEDARKAFKALRVDARLLELLLDALERQKRWPTWTKDRGQFVPLPATWLRQKRWEDEPPEVGAPARHTEPSHTGWACPHEPRCARQWDCHRKSEIAAMTEAS